MKRRYELARFDFSEADAIAEHLSAMAAKGWQLDRAGPYLWGYRKAEPQKLRYAVGYLPGIHSAAPMPPEELAAFRELYRAAGWRFAAEWYFVQLFCTDRADATPPDTDEQVKYDALRCSIGKQIWINALLAALMALLFGLALLAMRRNPLAYLSTNTTLAAPWLLLAACLSLASPIVRHALWSRRAARAIRAGGRCPRLGKRCRRLWSGVLWLVILLFAAAVISDAVTTTGAVWNLLRFAVWMGGFMALNSLNGWMRRRGGSRDTFWLVFAAGLIVLLIVYCNLPDGSRAGWVSPRELPLSSQDLGLPAEEDEICRLRVSESFLLKHVDGGELSGESQLSYDAYYPAAGWVRGFCRKELGGPGWEPLSDGVQIRTRTGGSGTRAAYLVETPEAILVLYSPEALDEGQLATAISLLAP